MTKVSDQNPWDVDVSAIESLENENKAPTSGLICPFRNFSIKEPCKGCQYIRDVYNKNFPDGHPAIAWAGQKKAKASVFFNIVKSGDPSTPYVLRLGIDAGSTVLKNAKADWTDILNPFKDKGREIKIKKDKAKGEKFPNYAVQAMLSQADYDVPEKTWKSKSFNLDQANLIETLKMNNFNDSNYIDISSLNIGEELIVRILPPWQKGELKNANTQFAQFIWRHWGLTQAQLDGDEIINWQDEVNSSKESDKEATSVQTPPWDNGLGDDTKLEEEKEEVKPPVVKVKPEKPECFGNSSMFDEDDAEFCMKCGHFKNCKKAIAHNS